MSSRSPRLRQRIKDSAVSDVFEKQFARESLKSDRLRVTILIGVILVAMVLLLLLALIFFDEFQAAFHGSFRRFLVGVYVVTGSTVLCLVGERLLIDWFIKNKLTPPHALKYLSALVETSIPTAGMIVGSFFLGPVYTLFTPATLIYPIFISVSALRLNVRLCIFTGVVAGVEYAALSMYFINNVPPAGVEPILLGVPHHLFKAILLVMTGVATGIVTLQIRKRILNSFSIIEERNRISRTFGEYVSPEVMGTLLDLKPHLRSESKNVCVMFLDIRNFTGFAEKRTPEEVVQYLESLFDFMIEIVNRHHGIINKFLGDGFMAVFGAPLSDGHDCANALEAAREILERVRQEAESGTILPTTVGIGLHAGEAVTGSIGSALRREYTVIGDVVNLAARIEKLNKQFDSQLLISERVWQAFDGGLAEAVPMGHVEVRGREQAIQIYQLA
ncbi:MAG TPA: adenylate/guanylate cyclase domain-containing protein [Pyrinomonadaceae bacterium]|jgi:adenylate cyclase